MEQPKDCIGYAGVVIPEANFYQGLYIVDRPHLHAAISRGQFAMNAVGFEPDAKEGPWSAIMCETAQNGDESVLAVAALAVSRYYGSRFFIVHGEADGSGFKTLISKLSVSSVNEARAAIEHDSEVLMIKRNLLKLMGMG